MRKPTSIGDLSLAIVCPMANEEDSAEPFVRDLLSAAEGFRDVRMFVVIDNACRDRSLERMQQYAKHDTRLVVIWAPENRNVVDAYVRGYREALDTGFDWILEIDAGYSHDPFELSRFTAQLEQDGWDCIFGSRFHPGASIQNVPLKRRALSLGGTWLANAILGTRLTDMTSGYQLFQRQVLAQILSLGIGSKGPFLQTEVKARCRNLRVCEVPISYASPSFNIRPQVLADALVRLSELFVERVRGTLYLASASSLPGRGDEKHSQMHN